MGNYDLYGNSYRTAKEAYNAEIAQCAEIDAGIAMQKVRQLEMQLQQQPPSQDFDFLFSYILRLEERIKHLENLLKAE